MPSYILICLLVAAAFVHRTAGRCKPNGESCSQSSDCCKTFCNNFVCSTCKWLGRSCSKPEDCCSNTCIFGFCLFPIPTFKTTRTPTITTTTSKSCTLDGNKCIRKEECCKNSYCTIYGYCHAETPPTPTTITTAPTCKVDGSSVSVYCHYVCTNYKCTRSCDCCNKLCIYNLCQFFTPNVNSLTAIKTTPLPCSYNGPCKINADCCDKGYCIPRIENGLYTHKCERHCADSTWMCDADEECCANLKCYKHACKIKACLAIESKCTADQECCEGPCHGNVCKQCKGNDKNDLKCTTLADCCEGYVCVDNACLKAYG